MRVAIVGFGPKGMFALERLLEHAHRRGADARPCAVTAYEPGRPGCGPNYDPAQPTFLRMNFAASQVDAWPPDTTFVPAAQRLDFAQWRSRHAPGDDESYPPRAQVGRYLQWCVRTLLAHRPRGVEVEIVRELVNSVEPGTRGWLVGSRSGRRSFDHVMLCLGHRWAEPQPAGVADAAVPQVPAFPVGPLMQDRPLAPGARVAVRGFALSFIDAALALTEGRGGAFSPTHEVGSLRYTASGREPGAIIPFSRSGRAMSVKPPPGRFTALDGVAQAAARARAEIQTLPSGFSVRNDVMSRITWLADEIARSSGIQSRTPSADVRTSIERSLAMAIGTAPPDGETCTAEAWRLTYPAIVARLGHGGLDDDEYGEYRAASAGMERIAFGPPPINAAKLLALADVGIVDLDHTTEAPGDRIDGVIDAVLPAPGVHPDDAGPIGGLLRAGVLTQDGRRGIRVAADARCLGPDGEGVAGLACAGRPTEDWVIGNDTLSRRLHPELDRWASSL